MQEVHSVHLCYVHINDDVSPYMKVALRMFSLKMTKELDLVCYIKRIYIEIEKLMSGRSKTPLLICKLVEILAARTLLSLS